MLMLFVVFSVVAFVILGICLQTAAQADACWLYDDEPDYSVLPGALSKTSDSLIC